MKRIAIILLFVLCLTSAQARGRDFPRWTFGAEWGYVATVQSGFHHNFFSSEGYRIDLRDNEFKYKSNADVYLHAGYNLSRNWNVSLYIGYAGVDDIHNVVPVSIRGTRYFKENGAGDRWLAFIDLGSGICLKTDPQEILVGKLGGGYRFSLSADSKIDLLFSVRMTYTHPQIIYDEEVITMRWTNRNNAYVGAASIGIGLTF